MGSSTVVMIVHKLSAVHNAGIVNCMTEGKVMATGIFEDVRKTAQDFGCQGKLLET